jgi:dihydropteroate synthase
MGKKLADLLAGGPVVMGVLNVTPDSFSDGGRFQAVDDALARAEGMIADGAAIIDIGGESTRPGAEPVATEEELARVMPVIRALRAAHPETWISIDTMKAPVMRAAAEAGADLINDVHALQGPGALAAARATALPVCLMHMQGEPRTMQRNPCYGDVVGEVAGWLSERVAGCMAAGISAEAILVDPGIGFGKKLEHNLALLAHLDRFRGLAAGLLIGVSRKSMFAQLLDLPVDQRLAPGLSAAAVAVWQGADIIRSHDVFETAQAVRTAAALRGAWQTGEALQ